MIVRMLKKAAATTVEVHVSEQFQNIMPRRCHYLLSNKMTTTYVRKVSAQMPSRANTDPCRSRSLPKSMAIVCFNVSCDKKHKTTVVLAAIDTHKAAVIIAAMRDVNQCLYCRSASILVESRSLSKNLLRLCNRHIAVDGNNDGGAVRTQMHYHAEVANLAPPIRDCPVAKLWTAQAFTIDVYSSDLNHSQYKRWRYPDNMRQTYEALAGNHVDVEDGKGRVADETLLQNATILSTFCGMASHRDHHNRHPAVHQQTKEPCDRSYNASH